MVKQQFDPKARWFNNCKADFQQYLQPYINQPAHFLEIGCYEGYCTTWLLDNILTHADSFITCIDPWSCKFCERVFQTFMQNISIYDNVIVHRGESGSVLRQITERFDFVYIDGDHSDYHPLEDAVLVFPLVVSGGLVCFDDYQWPKEDVTVAIDAFLSVYNKQIEIIKKEYQVWIRKK